MAVLPAPASVESTIRARIRSRCSVRPDRVRAISYQESIFPTGRRALSWLDDPAWFTRTLAAFLG
jgi:hypothetical protein